MKKYFYLLFFILVSKFSFTQNLLDTTHNCIYGGFARHSLFFAKIEHQFTLKPWTKTIVNFGVGGVPGEASYGTPRHNIAHIEIGQLFYWKRFVLELGIEPILFQYGKMTYINISAVIGLRVQISDAFFINAGHNPFIYSTHNGEIDLPFYLGFGLDF